MIDEQNSDDLIDKYLLGELVGDSLLEFQKRVADDPSFRKEVEAQQILFSGIRMAGRAQWKDRLELVHSEMNRMQSAPRKSIYSARRIWMAAASFLVIGGIFLVVTNRRSGYDRLFQQYFSPYPVLEGSTRSTEKGNETTLQKGISAYAAGNFTESINLLKNVPGINHEEAAFFYLGNAYLSNGQSDLAEATFKEYLSRFRRLATESKWYLCLSYLRQGKDKEARILLVELSTESNGYGKKAADLLKQF